LRRRPGNPALQTSITVSKIPVQRKWIAASEVDILRRFVLSDITADVNGTFECDFSMKVILVIGSWGSGTTALAGALVRLGIPGFGPYFVSDDPTTPNTFEMQAFRDVVLPFMDESTVSLRPDAEMELISALRKFRSALEDGKFGAWPAGQAKRVMLKLPFASLCIPQISTVFDTDVVLMLRRLQDVEASRRRRGWAAIYGRAGAQIIYSKSVNDLLQIPKSFLAISFSELMRDTRHSLERVINFCGVHDLSDNLDQAAAFVRKKG
jgi:hypothetical protein